jgi:hypothetical protein
MDFKIVFQLSECRAIEIYFSRATRRVQEERRERFNGREVGACDVGARDTVTWTSSCGDAAEQYLIKSNLSIELSRDYYNPILPIPYNSFIYSGLLIILFLAVLPPSRQKIDLLHPSPYMPCTLYSMSIRQRQRRKNRTLI